MFQQASQNRLPTAEEGTACSREMVGHYPLSSVTIMFGLGFGCGVVLGRMLGEQFRPRRTRRQVFEDLGRQLYGSVEHMFSETLSGRKGH